jgi:Histidine kinase
MSLSNRLLNFHRQYRWLSHVLYWLIVLLVAVSSSKYRDGKQSTYGFEFASDALYMSAEMMYVYALAYFVIPQFIYRKRYLLSAVGFLVTGYVACVIARIFIVKICEPLAGVPPKAFETYTEIFTDFPKLIYNYYSDMMATSSIFIFFKVFKDQLIAQKRALTLEKERAETELKLLKTQLNPHFLFNTLNNIYSLSLSSSPVTSPSIARLADILDHILYRCNDDFVSLKNEVTLIKNYVELEKLRYDERLTVEIDSQADSSLNIAPLILLSLVENAFKHGASDDTQSPVIQIGIYTDERNFIFKISNTTAIKNKETIAEPAERIGLNNLRRQLDLLYADNYSLSVTNNGKHFDVELHIELKQMLKHEKSKVLAG